MCLLEMGLGQWKKTFMEGFVLWWSWGWKSGPLTHQASTLPDFQALGRWVLAWSLENQDLSLCFLFLKSGVYVCVYIGVLSHLSSHRFVFSGPECFYLQSGCGKAMVRCIGAGEALGLRSSQLFSGRLGTPLQGADHRYALSGTMPRNTTTEFLSSGRSSNS